jgi:hypothetical protein
MPIAPAARATAHRLGLAGLLPFLAGAGLLWWLPPDAAPRISAALLAYAALIVSFLGGIHWGLGFRDGGSWPFVWGVMPSLGAWPALLLPARTGLLLLGALLLLCYAVDRLRYPRHGLADWLPLRLRLSGVAALCCFVGAAGA